MIDKVLVTGVSGFLGAHVALELLRQGYAVRGSVRNMAKSNWVSESLAAAGADVTRFEVCTLDLLKDDGWSDALAGCRYLLHVASPFVLTMPKDESVLLRPAVEGTSRAVQAALDGGVERIVLTSSVAAIDGGRRHYDRPLGPADWTDVNGPNVTAYTKSKTLAEHKAWAMMGRAARPEALAVINPGTIIGPLLNRDPGASVVIIQRMMRGHMPMLPDLVLPWVDVRDVAAAHVAAMTSPLAAGRRTIVTNAALSLDALADLLRSRLGPEAARVPTRRMPAWMASLMTLFDRSLRDGKAYLGIRREYDASGGPMLLGRPLRTTDDAVETTARSLLAMGLV